MKLKDRTKDYWLKKLTEYLEEEQKPQLTAKLKKRKRKKTHLHINKELRKWFSMCIAQTKRFQPEITRQGVIKRMEGKVNQKHQELFGKFLSEEFLSKSNKLKLNHIALLVGLKRVIKSKEVRKFVLNNAARMKVKKTKKRKRKTTLNRKQVKVVKRMLKDITSLGEVKRRERNGY